MNEMLQAMDGMAAGLWRAMRGVALLVILMAIVLGCASCATSPIVTPPAGGDVPVDPPIVDVLTGDEAVCVGVEYVSPIGYGGWTGECPGAAKDAKDMAKFYEARGYRVTLLLNEKATWANTEAAALAADARMPADAVLVLMMSSHGGQFADDNGDEAPQSDQDSTLCFHDQQVRDDRVKAMLNKMRPGRRVHIWSDQCHSQGNFRYVPTWIRPAARAVTRTVTLGTYGKPRTMRPRAVRLDDLVVQVCQYAGCRWDNFSLGGSDGGVMTQTFLREYRDGMTVATWFPSGKEEMPPNQEPMYVEGGPVTDAFRNRLIDNRAKTAPVVPAGPTIRAEWTPERRPKTAILTWNHPYDNTDGTVLTNLAAYRVYQLTDNGEVVRLREVPSDYAAPTLLHPPQATVFTNITTSKIVLGLTALNALGDESDMTRWITNKFSIPNTGRNPR